MVLMEIFILESGKMVKLKEWEYIFVRIKIDMKDNLKIH